MDDWQSITAVGVVALAIVALTVSGWRRMRKPTGSGCGGNCGCGKTELRARESGRA